MGLRLPIYVRFRGLPAKIEHRDSRKGKRNRVISVKIFVPDADEDDAVIWQKIVAAELEKISQPEREQV